MNHQRYISAWKPTSGLRRSTFDCHISSVIGTAKKKQPIKKEEIEPAADLIEEIEEEDEIIEKPKQSKKNRLKRRKNALKNKKNSF